MPASNPRRVRPVATRRMAPIPSSAIGQIAHRVLPEERHREPKQTVDNGGLQFPIEQTFEPEHGDALHRLQACHGDGDHDQRGGQVAELIELRARDHRIDERLGDERHRQSQNTHREHTEYDSAGIGTNVSGAKFQQIPCGKRPRRQLRIKHRGLGRQFRRQ